MRKHLIAFAAMMTVFAAATLALSVVFNGQGTLQVDEVISIPAVNLNRTIQPNQVQQIDVSVTNSGSQDVSVIVDAEVLNLQTIGPWQGITVTGSGTINVPANSTVPVFITISADNGVETGDAQINLSVIRP